jgi:2-polyprenyl-3-methyl-5-hydroxy-6-metoxy-1,4-benzoquinol methylase
MNDLMLARYPELNKLVDLVSSENPLQRKRIDAFLRRQEAAYFAFAESLSRTLNRSLMRTEQDRLAAARAYNRTCMDIVREQIRFRKTGKYLLESADVAEQTVYSQKERMRYYIIGLLLSYLFWPNHYQMFCFFRAHLATVKVEQCLEVGAGHGLFTAEILRRFPHSRLTLVDISATSIEVAREVLSAFEIDLNRIEFIHADYTTASLCPAAFDLIVMGEVLEHVNAPEKFLTKALGFLRQDGSFFLSTCANCPAQDHIYHFRCVEEIRDLIRSSGLRILTEQALPAEAVPEELWQKELVTINYSGILTGTGSDHANQQ